MHKKNERSYLRASLTIEASLVFPLFIFMAFLLMLPFKMMNTRRQMQAVAENICKEAAQYAYTADSLSSGFSSADGEDANGSDELTVSAVSGLVTGEAIGAYAVYVAESKTNDSNVMHLNGLRSNYMGDEETITVALDYDYKLPFKVFGLGSFPQHVQSVRRAWIGKTSDKDDADDTQQTTETMVYVGRSSTRYHMSPTCHYLYNDLTAVSLESVATRRNQSGGRYHACPRCASGVTATQVYIMPSGTAYHTDTACSAITAYARSVPLNEVEYLGACSYCSRGH